MLTTSADVPRNRYRLHFDLDSGFFACFFSSFSPPNLWTVDKT
jgi:hypothetical protein